MLRESTNHAWRIVVGGFVFAIGLVVSRLALQFVGVSPPRMPAQAGEAIAGYYLLAGSIALAAGMVMSSQGIRGTVPIRWLVLSTFVFIGFGVSSTVETAIYSSIDGVLWMVPALFLPCLLLAGINAALLKSPLTEALPTRAVGEALRRRTWVQWSLRGLGATAAFPVIYFVFGMIVSPVVSQYYEQGVSGLALPEPAVIVTTQFLRGALQLLAVLPVIVFWNGSKRKLVVAIALAFFVFVAAYDIVLAYRVPIVLAVIHGIEVLVTSLIYSWVLVILLAPEWPERGSGATAEQQHAADGATRRR